MYVELHSRSAFSFLEGASLPEALIAVCADYGMPAMALLDRNGVYGAARFHLAAQKFKLGAHIGAEVTVDDTLFGEAGPARYPLLVESREGYQNLCKLITRTKLRAKKEESAARIEELEEHATGLICLTGGDDGPLSEALIRGGYDEGVRTVERMMRIFGPQNIYLELQRHFDRREEARNQVAVAIARKLRLPILATNGVSYATAAEREILDVFTCIRHHRQLENAGHLLSINSERFIRTPAEMEQLFADLPEAISNTVELSGRLKFTLKDLGYEFPQYPIPEGETMISFLRDRTREGMRRRYGQKRRDLRERAREQIDRELNLIEKLNLAGYFLIVWDIVRFCDRENILVQGRGSAANSAVCYALGITAVDPIGMELLFERFLSEERGELPDIDLDLPSGDQRERVIQHVYAQYGAHGAAMTANVITYRGRSAAREIGKSLGFDVEILDRLSALVGSWEWKGPTDTMEQQFRHAGFDLHHPRISKFLDLALRVQDLPRHLGQHSGGMVVCQGQLSSVVPLEPASMPGRVVVQWDKEDCADLGLVKIDLLGLGMMAVLEDCIELIPQHYGDKVELAQLPQDDPQVYEGLQQADTVGLFQVESRAQMSALPRNRPKCFYDIVIQVAIIRPGPIVGKMMNPFLKRRQGLEPVNYAHPSLEPVLKRTLGVPLFQEQLLRMAMVVADFSGGEAEELRRAMGNKRSQAKMAAIETRLRSGMTKNGIRQQAQDEIVQSIVSFALYGFPESHAASFALLAYASAYLKCHYLAAFTAALLNNQPMGFYHPATIVKDAQRHGLRVRPVDVTRSYWPCTLECECGDEAPHNRPDCRISMRMGLRYVRGLREETALALVSERNRKIFFSVDNLARRVPELRRNELNMLAQIGALNGLGGPFSPSHQRFQADLGKGAGFSRADKSSEINSALAANEGIDFGAAKAVPFPNPKFHRRDALWQVEKAAWREGSLLADIAEPDSPSPLTQMTSEERLIADYHGTGLTVGAHPMLYRREEMNRMRVVRAIDLCRLKHGQFTRIAGCVIARQRPGTANGFIFLSLEDETGISNAIIMPDLYDQNRLLVIHERFLLIEGILQNVENVISVKALRVSRLEITDAVTRSHDFH
ncbi:MAG: error-prone DNA polymerase [Acidobacteria bacterium]|nr:MAG: error-prone DNA polymerase [Acidobacteriota bacterium]PYY24005.1 MAG: error-prone DNA polymerase [Acidobacteriota bacterium]